MASLKCSNCGFGIHYHDEPNGTEYVFIKLTEWERLIETKLNVSRYLLDGTEDYLYAWKCKECEAFMFMDNKIGFVNKVFVPAEECKTEVICNNKYIVFDDITWALITEEQINGRAYLEKFSNLSIMIATVDQDLMQLKCGEDITTYMSSNVVDDSE